ncbi:uncharacterized protein K489DRAFT_175291 [Dissoconium aciculare CBS 342.82]|uniref:Uncharacterized protein n=1 Tax=Dissoconium aciculare CBS 342.82 TaxID=1314786 RepID=A0A6J3M963_9PEZI|nr:uncharacterized protein K489DRAFT_175291 [Dissoconium aciculare CBS 342.82]KAF1824154.1 hypothetical protein K489DRAFT_175291 [Dissoconium aciculare CBS 342.82]
MPAARLDCGGRANKSPFSCRNVSWSCWKKAAEVGHGALRLAGRSRIADKLNEADEFPAFHFVALWYSREIATTISICGTVVCMYHEMCSRGAADVARPKRCTRRRYASGLFIISRSPLSIGRAKVQNIRATVP